MSLVDYAKSELARLEHDESGMQDMVDTCILKLLEMLSEQGHSNFSVHYCLRIFDRLARFKPLTPLTGEDDEWNEIEPGLYQNKRYSSVFKKGDIAYNIDGRIFSDDNGETWFTNKKSRVDITFPYIVPDKPEKWFVEHDDGNYTWMTKVEE